MMKFYVTLLLCFLSLSGNVFAAQEDKILSPSESCLLEQIHIGESTNTCLNLVYNACQDRTKDMSTLGISECLYEETAEWDEILNKYYRQIMALSNPYQKEFLRDTQRLWIKWRDKNCDYLAEILSGTMVHNAVASCMQETTFERVKDFENYLGSLPQD